MNEELDVEAVATHAINQVRLLRYRTELAADVALAQAIALLLDAGKSQRAIARLTGLSKSDVARRAQTRPPLGIAAMKGADTRVISFALEWIWGDQETIIAVQNELLREGADDDSRHAR